MAQRSKVRKKIIFLTLTKRKRILIKKDGNSRTKVVTSAAKGVILKAQIVAPGKEPQAPNSSFQ